MAGLIDRSFDKPKGAACGARDDRGLHLRCGPHADRALWRRARPCPSDDLAAIPIKALIDRNPDVNWEEIDDVILGCANQAGRGQSQPGPHGRPARGTAARIGGVTLNRLCGSAWTR
jgi:acetyl-CoA acetyltransferase